MTIFVKIAKELIDRVLLKSNEGSIAEDASYACWWRDTEISTKQRAMTRDLQKAIDAFVGLENDKASLDALKEAISAVDTAVQEYRKTKSWERGTLNATLAGINSNLDRFYKTVKTQIISLIDVADDDNPFNILCAHAIYYLGEHILCPPEEGIFVKTINLVTSFASNTSAIEIRDEKEKCLIRNLVACKKKIDGSDKSGEDYQILCKTFVTETIETILRENAKICEESKPINTVPIQVTALAVIKVKTPGMKPSRGRLKVAMENAQEDIAALPTAELSPALQ